MSNPWENDDYYSVERIEVVHGRVVSLSMQALSRARNWIDICCDKKGAPVFVNVNPINIGYASLKEKGLILRFLTDITPDNIPHVRKLMKTTEIRHLDNQGGTLA